MTEQWHPGDDLLLDVALGHAGDGERDRVGNHLAECPECRREHEDLLTGIDHTLAAVPRTAPPPGFETAVLTTLRDDRARPPRAVGKWLPVAAAGLLGIAIGVGGARVADESRDDPPITARTMPFVADDGSVVGSVSPGHGADGGQLAVVVSASAPGTVLTCRAVLADGTVHDLAQWQLSGYDDVWLVDVPASGVQSVELVDDSGEVWATAEP